MHIVTTSPAPNENFSFLDFFGVSHAHSVYGDGRIGFNFGIGFFIISYLGELGVFFLLKYSFVLSTGTTEFQNAVRKGALADTGAFANAMPKKICDNLPNDQCNQASELKRSEHPNAI